MDEAIARGIYNVGQYEEETPTRFRAPDVLTRVLIQEFAYFLICCYWNILEGYGPSGVAKGTFEEFTLPDRAAMQVELPAACALIEATVVKTLTAPPAALDEGGRVTLHRFSYYR